MSTSEQPTPTSDPGHFSPLPRPPSGSKRTIRKAVTKAVLKQAQLEWDAFPELPGNHLYLRKSGPTTWEYVNDTTGTVAVSCASSLFVRFPRSVTYQGRTYEWRRAGNRKFVAASRVRDLVNVATNSQVLRRRGIHIDQGAGTKIIVGGAEFSFPVKGPRSSAVMWAVDESAQHLVCYRSIKHQSKLTTEIVITPSALTIPNIHLLVAVSSRLIFDFFKTSGGGG
jgi:hypothetical protein